jgi:CHAT domain-containing protein
VNPGSTADGTSADRQPDGDPERTRPRLHISVVHGDLRHVHRPLLLGSFDGTPIAGAQGTLDSMLDGALTRRQAVGQHPGPLGTLGVFCDSGGQPAAVVIGIGDPGEITPNVLTVGVTQAVLRLAAGRLDAAGGRGERLDLAAVLIGTSGPAPLSVQSSVTAIVNGIRRANRRLRGLPRPTTIASLQIVELYEERAADAARALSVLLDSPDPADPRDRTSEQLSCDTRVITGSDGRSGQPRREDRHDEWSTIRVNRASGDGTGDDGLAALSFTRLGRGAGADLRITTTQRKLVDRLVGRSISSPRVDPQLYNTLYELLLPLSMKGQVRERDNIMYVVDEHAAALPLELLGTRSYDGTIRPMAVDVGVIRRLETPSSRLDPRVAGGTSALVIGNPPSRYADLPGAAEEARRVATRLRDSGYRVTELIADGPGDHDRVNAETIVNALFSLEHRILHIAGHGIYDPDQPASSGVLIGDDLYLTALEIQQMQAVPEMVFLNCCHSGAMQEPLSITRRGGGEPHITHGEGHWRPDHTAASIARALIDAGVRVVVAAGWAVNDKAAAEFAERLYQHLLEGTDLGHATLSARQHVHGGNARHITTWGAYQVYGPPAFTLTTTMDRPRSDDAPVSRHEFRYALQAVRDEARRSMNPSAIDRDLQGLLANAAPDWLGGDEHGLIGAIHAELGQYHEAIEQYVAAISRWGANARLKVIEQLANVEFKAAASGIVDPATALPAPDTPDELFERARRRIENLITLAGETPERLSLFGSYWARRAQAAAAMSGDVAAATAESATWYHEASEMSRNGNGEIDGYSAINYAVMEWIADQHRADPPDRTPQLLAIVEEAAEAAAAAGPPRNFWIRVTPADALFTRTLLTGNLVDGEAERRIAAAYEDAFTDGSSARERLTIVEHLHVVRDVIPDDDTHTPTRNILDKLAQRLAAWMPAE